MDEAVDIPDNEYIKDKNDLAFRVYYSMCVLNHTVYGKRFVCLQVLMTLCCTGRPDFLVYDTVEKRCYK